MAKRASAKPAAMTPCSSALLWASSFEESWFVRFISALLRIPGLGRGCANATMLGGVRLSARKPRGDSRAILNKLLLESLGAGGFSRLHEGTCNNIGPGHTRRNLRP